MIIVPLWRRRTAPFNVSGNVVNDNDEVIGLFLILIFKIHQINVDA